MLNEAHVTTGQRNIPLRDFLARARHEGCGGQALRAELLTGSEGVSSRPVRRVVLKSPPATGGISLPSTPLQRPPWRVLADERNAARGETLKVRETGA
jgi:hypothetical protein